VKRSRIYSIGVIAAIAAVAGIISVYVYSGGAAQSSTDNNNGSLETNRNNEGGISASQSRVSFLSLTSDGSPVQGDAAAPVTLVEFGDFQCEFCARFAKETEPQINQNYVQTGKINVVFKHLVHYGSDSDLAAAASQCANDQGKFWDYYHILYTKQDSFMLSRDTASALKDLASEINGLDAQKFESCLDGGAYKDVAKKDAQLADSLGFRDTPSFLIVKNDGSNPQTLVGAYPFGTFKAILDKEIGGAS
jgi:protein-disulfide isomerase